MPNYRQTYTLFKRGKYFYYQTYTPDGIRTGAKTTHQTNKTLAKNIVDYRETIYYQKGQDSSEFINNYRGFLKFYTNRLKPSLQEEKSVVLS